MDLTAAFKTDQSAEEEGVWVTLSPDFSVLIARHMNSKMREFVRKRLFPYAEQIKRGAVDDGFMEQVNLEAMATHVLVGWKGVATIEEDGAQVPLGNYTPERSLQLLKDLPELQNLIAEKSQQLNLFLAKQDEDTEGN